MSRVITRSLGGKAGARKGIIVMTQSYPHAVATVRPNLDIFSVFVADAPYRLIEATIRHESPATAAVNLGFLRKSAAGVPVVDATAVTNSTKMSQNLTGSLSLDTAHGVLKVFPLVATESILRLARGDLVFMDLVGMTFGAFSHPTVTLKLLPLSDEQSSLQE